MDGRSGECDHIPTRHAEEELSMLRKVSSSQKVGTKCE
jgi:hypothetical protein